MMFRMSCGIAFLFAAGCGSQLTYHFPDEAPASAAPKTSLHDPARCGTITGFVTWSGPIPEAPTFLYGVPRGDGNFLTKTLIGPNQPRIDAATRAVAGVVVTLRGIDPAVARPWNLPPVRIELGEGAIHIQQGPCDRVGFVRLGDGVEVVSREPSYHILRGRGNDFFSLSLPAADQPRTRTFTRSGRVELSSGSGYYWARADLFVTNHPYWTVTDAAGRFTLPQVPEGRMELVAWHPSWRPARQDRDPETGLVSRMTYQAPLERTTHINVTAGATADVAISLE